MDKMVNGHENFGYGKIGHGKMAMYVNGHGIFGHGKIGHVRKWPWKI